MHRGASVSKREEDVEDGGGCHGAALPRQQRRLFRALQRGGNRRREGRGGEIEKHDLNVDHRQPDEGQEEVVGERAEEVLAHLPDRSPLVPEAGDEGGVVVDAADENRTQHDPEQRGQPTERQSRDDGADDRAGARDRAEVVAEEHTGSRRHIVHVVVQRMSRRGQRA